MKIFPDAVVSALLGYGVVFFGLVLLLVVVVLMGKVMSRKKPAPVQSAESAPASQAPAKNDSPEAPGSAGEVRLYNVSDRDAALLMAIVAHKLGKPVNQLRFKSIKEVK